MQKTVTTKTNLTPARTIRRRQWFRLLLPILCFLLFVYPILRIATWYQGEFPFTWAQLLLLWVVPTLGVWLGMRRPDLVWLRFVMLQWLGVTFIFFSLTLLYEPVHLLLPVDDRLAALILLATGAVLSLAAFINAHLVFVKKLMFSSDKLSKSYRLVQISDIHIGSRRRGFLQRLVRRVNTLDPDYVLITGDLLDAEHVGQRELLPLQELTAPAFFITGNHERYVGLDTVIPVLTALGVRSLRNTTEILTDIELIGIDDVEDPEQVNRQLARLKTDSSRYRILLYHRPTGWPDAVSQGIELMLCGHTHNGQIVPFNLLVKRHFPYVKGLFSQAGSHLYVSTGSGTWGPVMRLGSVNEITCIDLQPG
jgi:predicted MPP superfamily phosphohydrolase